jgi:hypothetical protein
MNFIDNIDFVFALGWRKINFVPQISYILNAIIGRRVDFDQVKETILIDGFTVLALVTGALRRISIRAVDRFRQQTRQRSLACPTRTGEEIGMGNAIRRDGVLERRHHVILPYNGIP